MERVGVRELRQHASRYLSRVKAGETLEITERGRLIALLVPPGGERSERERLIADGILLPASGPFTLPPRVAARPGELSTGEILDELRDERL